MKKRIIGILLVALLIVCIPLTLAACGNNDKSRQAKQYTVVYVGDSIAEAIIGPSPLSERDNYGYYALLGRINNFRYYNHAISGHKTSTGIVSGEGLLETLQHTDENAVLMKTHLQQADMIHVSVLGNNLLQYNIGLAMLEVADPEFPAKYEAGKNATSVKDMTIVNALEDGNLGEPLIRKSVEQFDENGKPIDVKYEFPPTYQNVCEIVDTLKALNPTATIVFQKVYNPFFEGCKHLSEEVLDLLAEITDADGRFGEAGQKITTIKQIRKLADTLLGYLNGMLDRYDAEHPNTIKILEANKAFDEVVALQVDDESGEINLSEESLGRKLIFNDWTHPSNFGHAVIAGCSQKMFEEMGIASPDAVSNYKAIKVEQINRLYAGIADFDKDAAIGAINSAQSFLDVTLAYFRAVDGRTPIY